MRTTTHLKPRTALVALALALLSTFNTQLSPLFAQTTTITYQGRVTENGAPVTGTIDLEFRLFSAAIGGQQVGSVLTHADVGVTNGLFSVALEFGGGAFPGADRFLEIKLRPGTSSDPHTLVTPRQAVTPSPYAITAANIAGTLGASQLTGTYTSPVTFNNAGNSFTGNGAGLSNVNALTLDGFSSSDFWKTGGNAGTTPGVNSLGTTDNQPLELRVNNSRALRIEPRATSPNIIGGFSGNAVEAGYSGSVIGGGGQAGLANTIVASYATIAGGGGNNIATFSSSSAIGGGGGNNIWLNSTCATIAGGNINDIGNTSTFSAIGGGLDNNIGSNSVNATIAGGANNDIGNNSDYSAIGGGRDNNTADNSAYATIPGGENNFATSYAFAAGRRAKATYTGSFIWADSNDFDFSANIANKVRFRCTGGFDIITAIDGSGTETAAVWLDPGGQSWQTISDRNAKKNIRPVDAAVLLDKLAAVPVTQWNYRWEEEGAVPHLGPMAQDFKAAFFPGRDDKSISTLEFDGVALAAIQGLNEKVESKSQESEARSRELEAQLREKEARIRQLDQRLAALETRLAQ